MKTLAIDCATEACSIALFEGDERVAGELRMLGRGHAEHLVPMISQLPQRGRADRIAVALGPGSFTGVRIGLAAARALGLAWGAEVVGYPTLALIAAMAQERLGGGNVSIAMRGGHGEWFVQDFDGDLMPEAELASMPPDTAVRLARHEQVAGTEAEALVSLRGHGRALEVWPDAGQLMLLPPNHFTDDLAPLYGRGPDARLPGVPK
jgi:tRNA threonylcarbamoyl adenosine modification protein YeaZ